MAGRLRTTGWLPALMIFYLAWSIASVLWSIDPGMSCRRLAVLMFCVRGSVRVCPAVPAPRRGRDGDGHCRRPICWWASARNWRSARFRPWSPDYRFAGTVHPNTQGTHLAVFCLASFWPWHDPQHGEGCGSGSLFAVGLVFLLLTKSRTSCAAFGVALAALWLAGASGRTQGPGGLGRGICTLHRNAGRHRWSATPWTTRSAKLAMLGRQDDSEALTGRHSHLGRACQLHPGQAACRLRLRIVLDGRAHRSGFRRDGVAAPRSPQYLYRRLAERRTDWRRHVSGHPWARPVRAAAAFRKTGDPGFALTFCLLVFGTGQCLPGIGHDERQLHHAHGGKRNRPIGDLARDLQSRRRRSCHCL